MRRRGWIAAILLATAILLIFLLVDQFLRHPSRRPARGAVLDVDQALGATLEPLDQQTATSLGLASGTRGLVVTSISATGPAAGAGVRTGDVIESVGRAPVKSLNDIRMAIGTNRRDLTLRLNRHRHYAIVHLSAG